MRQKPPPSVALSLLAGLVLALLSLYGFFLLRSRPGLPEGIRPLDVDRVDDFEIQRPKDLEFVLAQKRVGDWATFIVRSDGGLESIRSQIIAFYSQAPFPLIYLFIGLASYLVGFTVFILKWKDPKARLLYWLSFVFGYTLTVNGGTYLLGHGWVSYVPVILFYLFYPLAPALLLHFSLSFGSMKWRRRRLALVYLPSLLFGAFFVAAVLTAFLKSSLVTFRVYVAVFQFFRVYLIILLLLAVFHFVLAYRRAALEERRAPLKWVFLGLLFGLSPFILLYQLPTILGARPLLGEDSSAVFFLFIPLAFALSILRFRLLDVEVVINRSLVYSLLTVFTVGVYLFSVHVLQDLFSRVFVIRETFISLGSAFLAALAFHPARRGIQGLVDRTFFRQSYDYKKAVLSFNETSQKAISGPALVAEFVGCVESILPMDRLAVAVDERRPEGLRPLYSRGLSDGEPCSSFLSRPGGHLWARRGAARTEEGVDFSLDELLSRSSAEMALPLPFQSSALTGFLLLGEKRSGQKYTRDDIDLLLTLAGELALSLEMLKLQEEVIYERASKEKLDELNRLKTEFISSVSHELRTPMSSIQGLTELLQEGKVKDEAKRQQLVAILATESGRLSRLIHNILDFGKIEQQAKTYHLERTEAGPLIEEAVDTLRHRLEAEGFRLRLGIPACAIRLTVDRDAVKQVLINLIDNAVKYSPEEKEIEIQVSARPGAVEIEVSDRGIGIPEGQQDKIFDRFYRAPEAARVNPKGVGLGLKIVKHIMDAHRGEIRVESRSGGGTTFRLIFPEENPT
jgi:signal transduction histidine kinase